MNRYQKFSPQLDNLIKFKKIHFTTLHTVGECISILQQADGKYYNSVKIATYIDFTSPDDQITRFKIKNWYGSVKVLATGSITQTQEKQTLVQCDFGIRQLDAFLWLAFPVFALLVLYDSTKPLFYNLVILLIGLVIFFCSISVNHES